MRRSLLALVRGTAFRLPALSATMERGTVTKWLKQPGDPIAAGDVVFVMETDKAAMDVEAPDDGVMARHLVSAGASVPIGTPVAVLVGKGQPWGQVDYDEAPAAPAPAAAAAVPAPRAAAVAAPPAPVGRRTAVRFPSVALLLAHHGLTEASVQPRTGAMGQLLKGDVLSYLKRSPQPARVPTSQSTTARAAFVAAAVAPAVAPGSNPKANVAHAYSSAPVDLAALSRLFGGVKQVPLAQVVEAAIRRARQDVPSLASVSVLDLSSSGVSSVTGIIGAGHDATVAIGGVHAMLLPSGEVTRGCTLTLSADAALGEDAERFLGLVAAHVSAPNEVF